MILQIIDMLIPESNKRTRPGTKREPRSITIHETDNTNVRANALAHAKLQFNGNARQASWQYQVDDEPEIYRSVPDDEVAYAAGDGSGPGNSYSIHIEICVNRDGNFLKAVNNAAWLVKYLLDKYPTIKHVDVVQHHKWSGKNCPRYIRSGTKGVNWNDFIAQVRGKEAVKVEAPKKEPAYKQTAGNFAIGQKVKVKKSATHYATGQKIPAFVKGKTDTVMQRGSNRILLKGIYSWVKTSDLEAVGKAPKPTQPKAPTPVKKSSYTGDSIVDYLVSIERDHSFGNRKKLAAANGIKGYTGTPAQNKKLLEILRGGNASVGQAKKSKKTVTLPASVKTWRTYKLNVQPVTKNSDWSLTPSAFGGLTYDILGEPYPDVVTIETSKGKRNIFVGPSTPAIVK